MASRNRSGSQIVKGGAVLGSDATEMEREACVPEVDGAFVHVYDPSGTTGNARSYNNDHTVVFGLDGLFHKIGILNIAGGPHSEEKQLDHITSPDLMKNGWQSHRHALIADEERGEVALWAPHIVGVDGIFYMFYSSYTPTDKMGQIFLATSRDLYDWERHPKHPIISPNALHARDPMVLFLEDRSQWVLYYTANDEEGRGTVAYRTSPDLVNWSGEKAYALVGEKHDGAGNAESPFIVEYRGYYYLFVTSWTIDYNATRVFRSTDPLRFSLDQQVTTLTCHASEIIEHNGEWYLTHCGSRANGFHVGRLKWVPSISS